MRGDGVVEGVREFLAGLARWRTLARDWSDSVAVGSAEDGAGALAAPSGDSGMRPGDPFVLWG